ncbi:hypothetical protein ACGFZP_31775 [Kitasatospora sp. NPDC048239]|uniref:hypothetical protein n=1 Tax=Kitasatospora sp. NPDC048239 TaxID=3364046 RepID=UPI0037181179
MDASTAAVLGALVGAVGGIGGGTLTLLGQAKHLRSQQQADRERWLLELRRDAYSQLVLTAKRLSNVLWKAGDQLGDSLVGPSDWQAAFAVVHDAWTEFSTAAAAVSVAGPGEVASAANQLRRAMHEWDMRGADWWRCAIAGNAPALRDCKERFEQAARAKRPLAEAFEESARRALGTDA